MLSHILEFAPERDAQVFEAASEKPAVFLLRPEAGDPYVSKTANLRRRLMRLLARPEERSRRLSLRDRARRIEYSLTGSDFESGLLLYKALRAEFPRSYRDRLRLRPAPLIKFHISNRYPRVSITTQLGSERGGNVYYGPYPTRAAAEKFANDALDLFKMRRCIDDLKPDPAFPGCIYSEMNMCLAPCFQGCSDEEYAYEVERVKTFFNTRGQSLLRELTVLRDRASEQLAFEEAAGLHSRLEKAERVAAQLPEIAHRLDRLNGVLIQPSAVAESVQLFRIVAGCISNPVMLAVSRNTPVFNPEGGPQTQNSGLPPSKVLPPRLLSMESRILEALAGAETKACGSRAEAMEHLAILKRWYFKSSKSGEIFFEDANGELPMRRVVRAVSRVVRGEKPAADLSESAGDYWINRGREAQIDQAPSEERDKQPRPE